MSDRILRPRLFAGLGSLAVGLAVLWWYVVFGPVVARGYGSYVQASQCLWGNDYVCALLLSLCDANHPLLPKFYRPELFWAGSALILGAAGAGLRSKRTPA
ncbi:hypothetical protein [Fuscibacter oryzae]|uniref:Transmembrane protein n=1 Tax=Fuscibacter oryzae TaxID=2803939 RepID=A0A8J7STK9_9RHOB|nr:hypothetical protein [Fuscibacter oryzae]MBL4926656.1 hypothetical protein [Fuscibacter oryzae]